ncbi:MAG TPA: 23S rRNA (guanosine(2251)-2'-O)-methyltransferase RlmB [Bryobacteraceae bacterium]|nr:23S rRNA (guanosine(2251)-2'-O)-methyltransferase RlmB [Bryobacteraceae bacterium]
MQILAGIHPILAALKSGQSIDRISIAKGSGGARLQEIIDICRERKVPVRFEPRETLDRASRTAVHQGVIAYVAASPYRTLEDVAGVASMLVILDGVEDPHNLGAIIRTAHAAGASAVVIPERRAAPVTEVVAKAAAGALAHLPVVKVGNVNQTIERLKKQGYWIYGLDERGMEHYDTVSYSEPAALVVGAEGHGLHDLVAKHCDVLVRIPMGGEISSLNVSVATGVALFEWKRRRKAGV